MFGGNFSENGSFFFQNYGAIGGAMSVIEVAYVKISNTIFVNQSAFSTGNFILRSFFLFNYFIFHRWSFLNYG